jgi:PAS domain-containing protein
MILQSTRALTAAVGLLLAVQLLTTLGTVVLLGRMSPAIEKILRENVASGEAVERMALVLALAPADAQAAQRFRQSLTSAKRNITLPEERAEIATLERLGDGALAGEWQPLRESAEALARLGDLNRNAMREADGAAQRLGTAGAWAVVFLGLVGMLISGITVRRLQRRVLAPIAEMARAVAAYREGDRARRCTNADATDELALIMASLNDLFDRRERERSPPEAGVSPTERALVTELLDTAPVPTIAIDARGKVLAASRSALALLARPSGLSLRQALVDAIHGRPGPPVASLRRVGETDQWVCTLSPSSLDDPPGAART